MEIDVQLKKFILMKIVLNLVHQLGAVVVEHLHTDKKEQNQFHVQRLKLNVYILRI